MTTPRTKGRFVKLPYALLESMDPWAIAVYAFIAKHPPTYDVTDLAIEKITPNPSWQGFYLCALKWLVDKKFVSDVTKETSKGTRHVYKVIQ